MALISADRKGGMSLIEFVKVSKYYKQDMVIQEMDLTINKGELVVLIGPSGCGKTTTLKMINRLIQPSSGKILIDGVNIMEQDVISLRRNIGYVIQQTGLFPHMTVEENIQVVPKLKKMPPEEIKRRTLAMMEMVGMDPEEFLHRYPIQLSGGQQQRIGVARAFATDPDIILMDEPFSALDPITRSQLQDELVELQGQLHKTIVFVTHDMDEAIKIADRICILNGGKILQYGTPEEILKNPAHGFVSEFVGRNRIWNSPELIKAGDIMISDPVTTRGEHTLLQAIEVMRQSKVDSLMVVNSRHQLKGIISARMIRQAQDKNALVRDCMDTQCISISRDDSIVNLLRTLKDNQISAIPVLGQDRELAGVITTSSLVTTLGARFIDA